MAPGHDAFWLEYQQAVLQAPPAPPVLQAPPALDFGWQI